MAAANGTNQLFVGSNPTYSPALMKTAAAGALQKSYMVVQSICAVRQQRARPDQGAHGVHRQLPERHAERSS